MPVGDPCTSIFRLSACFFAIVFIELAVIFVVFLRVDVPSHSTPRAGGRHRHFAGPIPGHQLFNQPRVQTQFVAGMSNPRLVMLKNFILNKQLLACNCFRLKQDSRCKCDDKSIACYDVKNVAELAFKFLGN